MKARAVDVAILSDKSSDDSDVEIVDGIPVNRMSHLIWAPILKKKALFQNIVRSKPDVVVWYGTYLSAAYLTQLRSIGKPLIWDIERDLYGLKIFRGISFREMFHPHHSFLWQQILTALIPRPMIRVVANSAFISRIVVPSQSLKMPLCEIGVEPAKIVVVPSTLEKTDYACSTISKSSQESKKKAGFGADDFIVAYFGSPCTLRGVDEAIFSMRKILTKRKDIKLVIFSRRDLGESSVADGYLKAEEENLMRLIRKEGLEEYIRIIPGILDRFKLQQYLCASDVIVLPFKLVLSEPPLSVLEAMSMGKAVVTTNLGSLPEIVGGDRGILIDPNNPEQLATVILYLAGRADISLHLGEIARKFASALPSWDDVTIDLMQVLNAAIQGPK